IHFGPTSTLENKTKMVRRNWANSRAGAQRGPASGWQPPARKTTIPIPVHVNGRRAFFCQSTCQGHVTSVSGVRTAQCVAELLLNAKGELRGMVSRQNVAASTVQQLGEDFSVVRSIHR